MADSTDILREFLVAIGFDVDKAKYKAAMESVEKVSKRVTELAASVEAAAIAVEAGVVKIAANFETLYWSSQRLNAAASNVSALGFAFSQLGGNKEQAVGALKAIQDFITLNPAGEGVIKSLGIATRNANGQLRDTSDILQDLGARWRGMPLFRANIEATQLFGIDPETLRVLMRDTGQFEAVYRSLAKRFGIDQEQAAGASLRMMQDLRTVQAAVLLALDRVFLRLQAPLESQLQKFLVWLEANGDQIAAEAIAIGAGFIRFLTQTGEFVGRVVAGLIALDHATHGWSTRIIEAALAWKLLGIGTLVNALFGLGKLIAGIDIAGMFAGAGGAIAAVGAALAGPLGLVLLIVAALAAMVLRSKEFRDALIGAVQSAFPALQQAFGALISAGSELFRALEPLGKLIWEIGQRMINALGPVVVQSIASGIRNLTDLIVVLADAIRVVADLLQGHWAQAWTDWKQGFRDQLKLMRDEVAGMGDLGKAGLRGIEGAADGRYRGDGSPTPAPTDGAKPSPLKALWDKITDHKPKDGPDLATAMAGAMPAANDNADPLAPVPTLLTRSLYELQDIRSLLYRSVTGQGLADTGLAGSGGVSDVSSPEAAPGAAHGSGNVVPFPRSGATAIGAAVRDFLTRNGVMGPVAQGVGAGVVAEGGTPTAFNGSGGGQGAYGIGQWRGDRLRKLIARYGNNPTFAEQLEFLLWELRGGDRGGPSVLAARSADEAMRAYITKFMRPGAGTAGDLARGAGAQIALGLDNIGGRLGEMASVSPLAPPPGQVTNYAMNHTAGPTVSLHQQTDIHVQGGGPASETAGLVVDAQRNTNNDMLRRMKKVVA